MYYVKIILLAVFTILPGWLNAQNYYVYVAAESEDKVYLVRYDADLQKGFRVDSVDVGIYPAENEGPHGINISPDGDYWFVSVAHGNPYGWLYKFETGSNEFVEKTELGMFPASMEISPATGLLYVVNFNLHGDPEPSTVSVVDPQTMDVIADIPTGIMPHGSRISPNGTKQYHVSMMTDELMEIDAARLQVSRRLNISRDGSEMKTTMAGHDNEPPTPKAKPTWADPHPSKPFVYVANNGADEIVEIHTGKWEVTRRFSTGKAPYNLEVSHDGALLVASYKGEGATGVWDLESGKELAKIRNSRSISHGVSISSDNRFAFISVEGVRGEPGSVDVIDLENLELAEVIEVGKQAGGIIFWKKE